MHRTYAFDLSLLEQCTDSVNPEQAARPSTPPGIKVFTPPPTPKCEAERCTGTIVTGNSKNANDNEEEVLVLPIQIHTRECEEERYLGRPTTSDLSRFKFPLEWLQPSPKSVRNELLFSLPSPTDSQERRVMHHNGSDVRTDLEVQLSLLKWFSAVFPVPPIDQTQNVLDRTALQEAGACVSTATIDPLLRKIVLENLSTKKAPLLMIRRIQNAADMQALRSLLGLRGDITTTLQAFAQRLLLPATANGNLPLVQILLEAGVDPNTRTRTPMKIQNDVGDETEFRLSPRRHEPVMHNPNMTALHIAVYNRREDMVELLLCHGATDWRAELQGTNGYVIGSILDVIMEMGTRGEWTMEPGEDQFIRRTILKTVLHFGSSIAQQSHDMLLRALRHAVLRNRLDSINVLLEYQPKLLTIAKRIPWILLEAAATLPDLSMFEFLVSKGLSPTITSSYGHGSALAAAVATKSSGACITQLLQAHVDVNSTAFGLGTLNDQTQATTTEAKLNGIYGLTALQIAVGNRDDVLTRLLLYHGANPNTCCRFFPIQLAAWNGDEPIIKMLIKAGADANAVFHQGQSSFPQRGGLGSRSFSAQTPASRLAAERGHLHLVAVLDSYGTELPIKCFEGDRLNCMEVLCDAIINDDIALVKQLLSETTIPDSRIHPQYSARLMVLAVRKYKNRILRDLLVHLEASPYDVVDPDLQGLEDVDDNYMFHIRESAFEKAVKTNSMDAIELFLEFPNELLDDDHRVASKRQISAAYASALCTGDSELQAILLMHGLDPTTIDQFMGPNYVQQQLHFKLQHAAESRDLAQVERLLEAGAEPDSPNQNTANTSGMLTPLQYAVKHNHISMAEKLIQAGAAVNAPANLVEGRTALQLAASNGNREMAVLLVNAGALINARPAAYRGRTAMEAAAEGGHLEVANYLLAYGADLRGPSNVHYRRSVYRAWQNDHHVLAAMLHGWMMERYSRKGTESIDSILESMTEDELTFIDDEARSEYEAHKHEYDSGIDSEVEEEEEEEMVVVIDHDTIPNP
jgi:ankyrin repeat protein